MTVEARKWIQESDYQVPERMPNVDLLYKAGASYVSVDEYDEVSEQMVLGVTFPDTEAKTTELWLHIANCEHDGVNQVADSPVRITMLILGHED